MVLHSCVIAALDHWINSDFLVMVITFTCRNVFDLLSVLCL